MFRRWKKSSRKTDSSDNAIGHYRLIRRLGEGGMGVVHEAIDERLHRRVAIKKLRNVATDRSLRDRLWREARMAAGINHPNICQVYEIGEEKGELFIAMECLEGEPLDSRIAEGPLSVAETIDVATGILAGLGALHRQGIVHRDLKPSNIFLTEHGVKLLDFGLARPHEMGAGADHLAITQTGAVLGTPRYMSPEQWGDAANVGPASDVFSLGAILHEMLTGEPAFGGQTLPEVFHAINHDHPPPLGVGAVEPLDPIIQKALAKKPDERYPDADAMADAVRLIEHGGREVEPPAPKTKRLIVLPFRMLRTDADLDFLSFSLPDAIIASLSAIDSIVVRSSAAVWGTNIEDLDLEAIATEAGVEAVLCGSLLRAGDKIRVSSQLVEAPSGTVISTRTAEAPLDDIFQLQDDVAREIIDSLSLSIAGVRDEPLQRDVPASPNAYEAYLRANQLAINMRLLADARDLYLSSLNEDPHYAPAWARLGRVYRIMAKYGHGSADKNYRLAEEAFEMALNINPDLAVAHNLLTSLEVEGGAAEKALKRLLQRARMHAKDPEIFAGLVMACRFCGLLQASVSADRKARKLDPGIRTSVSYTYWVMGDYENAMRHDEDDMRFVTHYSLPLLGRADEAIKRLHEAEQSQPPGLLSWVLALHRAGIEQDRDLCLRAFHAIRDSGFRDPEGRYFQARSLARVGERDDALGLLRAAVEGRYYCHAAMTRDPWFETLRDDDEFRRLVRQSEAGQRAAIAVFRDAGGEELLGLEPDPA